MAPIKALCQEKMNDWKIKFQKIGLKCAELTGDTENSNLKDFGDVDIMYVFCKFLIFFQFDDTREVGQHYKKSFLQKV
jgi:hypothetical protein